MFLLALIESFFFVYTIMLFIRILGSWVPEWSQSRFMMFIATFTDPFLNVFRAIIPPLGMIDISPIIAFFALGIMKNILLYLVSMLIR